MQALCLGVTGVFLRKLVSMVMCECFDVTVVTCHNATAPACRAYCPAVWLVFLRFACDSHSVCREVNSCHQSYLSLARMSLLPIRQQPSESHC